MDLTCDPRISYDRPIDLAASLANMVLSVLDVASPLMGGVRLVTHEG